MCFHGLLFGTGQPRGHESEGKKDEGLEEKGEMQLNYNLKNNLKTRVK